MTCSKQTTASGFTAFFFIEANIKGNLEQAGFDEFVRDDYEIVDKVNAKLKKIGQEEHCYYARFYFIVPKFFQLPRKKIHLWPLRSCLISIPIAYIAK